MPLLLQYAANTKIWVRYQAMVSLGAIHAEPERVIPVLINALNDPNENVQNVAVQSLGQFDEPGPAVPPLIVIPYCTQH